MVYLNLMNKSSLSNPAAPLPQRIQLRAGTEEDEISTFEVMRRAMKIEVVWEHHRRLRDHLRVSDGSSFQVAEEISRIGKPRIVGYARSIVREDVWMLTEFFLIPGYQHRGLGKALLTQVLLSATTSGAKRKLILASQDPAADALYIKMAGCIPRVPMLMLSGSPKRLKVSGNEADSVVDTEDEYVPYRQKPRFIAEPLLLTPEITAEINRMDRRSVGFARPQEHAYWTEEMSGDRGTSRLFREVDEKGNTGEIVGYAYAGRDCGGPVSATEAEYLPHFFSHVMGRVEAKRKRHFDLGFMDTNETHVSLAGTNEVALRWLLGCGWRITSQFLLMTDFTPGNLEGYLGHHPPALL